MQIVEIVVRYEECHQDDDDDMYLKNFRYEVMLYSAPEEDDQQERGGGGCWASIYAAKAEGVKREGAPVGGRLKKLFSRENPVYAGAAQTPRCPYARAPCLRGVVRPGADDEVLTHISERFGRAPHRACPTQQPHRAHHVRVTSLNNRAGCMQVNALELPTTCRPLCRASPVQLAVSRPPRVRRAPLRTRVIVLMITTSSCIIVECKPAYQASSKSPSETKNFATGPNFAACLMTSQRVSQVNSSLLHRECVPIIL
ncbi:uncharacterized protein [Periplaneta americana]|uniref:uncharacterized protein n=1 Tax=Periplaneta americana TaxID=6978 RepID=UPI0037E9BB5D